MKRKTLIAMLAAMLSLALCTFGVACGIADDEESSSSTGEHVHSLTAVAAKEATCTVAGNTAYWTCECGKFFADAEGATETTLEAVTLAASGHTFGDWQEKTAATCTAAGEEERECSVCHEKETQAILALGHDIENHAAQAATCTEEGWNAYETCKRTGCTYNTKVVIPALGHDIENHAAQAATCTEEGWNAYETCKRTGCTYNTKVVIPALGHEYQAVAEKPATYYEAGVAAHYKCSRCDELFVKNGEVYTGTTLADLTIAKLASWIDGCETATEPEGLLHIETGKVKQMTYSGVYNVDGKVAYYFSNTPAGSDAETRFVTEGTDTTKKIYPTYVFDQKNVRKFAFDYKIKNSCTNGVKDRPAVQYITQILGSDGSYDILTFEPVFNEWGHYEYTLTDDQVKKFSGFIVKMGGLDGEMLIANVQTTMATMVDGCETAAEAESVLHIEDGKTKKMTYNGVYNVDGKAAYYFSTGELDGWSETRFVTVGTDTKTKINNKYTYAPQKAISFSFEYKVVNINNTIITDDNANAPYFAQILGSDGQYYPLELAMIADGQWHTQTYEIAEAQQELFSGFILKLGRLEGEMLVANIQVETVSLAAGCETAAEAESVLHIEDGKTKKMTYNGVYNVDGKAAYYFSTGELDGWSETRFVTVGTDTKTKINNKYTYAPQKATSFSFDYKIRNISKTIITDDGANAPYFVQILGSDGQYYPLELAMIADGQWHTQTYEIAEAQQELFSGFVLKLGRLKGEMFVASIQVETVSLAAGCETAAEAESVLHIEDGKTKKMTYNGVYNVDGKAAYYFSTGELDGWSETRFVTVGTNTKIKPDGTHYLFAPQKITSFSFDYKIRNISKTIITDDGANAPYFAQIICSDSTYFPLKLAMIADGQWHTQTYEVPEAQQELFSGFIVKLGRLKGEMFIANIHAELDGAVAAIGNMQYLDLQSAFNAAKDGDTVKLLRDYSIPEDVENNEAARNVIKTKITLDFGPYRIFAPAKMSEFVGEGNNHMAIYVTADTIFKAEENGGIVCELSEDGIGPYGVNIMNGAKLTVNGGTYVGGGTAFQVQKGELEILGGKFSCNPFDDPYGYNFLINCIDSAYKDGTAVVGIKGGSFANFNPANCKAEGENTNFVADGYTVEDLGETAEYRYVVKAAE